MMRFGPPVSRFCISSIVASVTLLDLEVITLEFVLVVTLYQTKSTEPHIFQLVKEMV